MKNATLCAAVGLFNVSLLLAGCDFSEDPAAEAPATLESSTPLEHTPNFILHPADSLLDSDGGILPIRIDTSGAE